MSIRMFYDLETTGLVPGVHGIHHISGMMEKDGKVMQKFDFKDRPFEGAVLDPYALEVGRVTAEQVMSYQPMEKVYKTMMRMFARYVDKYDRQDKMWLTGYNNATFDDLHLQKFWEQNGDPYFYSWFWGESLDVRVLAGYFLQDKRHEMRSFKLVRVAKEVGIEVDKSKLHDAEYDVHLTRQILLMLEFL